MSANIYNPEDYVYIRTNKHGKIAFDENYFKRNDLKSRIVKIIGYDANTKYYLILIEDSNMTKWSSTSGTISQYKVDNKYLNKSVYAVMEDSIGGKAKSCECQGCLKFDIAIKKKLLEDLKEENGFLLS